MLTFAGDVELVQGPGAPAPIEPGAAPRTAHGHRPRAAPSTAPWRLLPSDGQRRLLLLSDGNETRGDSRRQMPWLRAEGVRVDAAVPPHRSEPDVRIDKLDRAADRPAPTASCRCASSRTTAASCARPC